MKKKKLVSKNGGKWTVFSNVNLMKVGFKERLQLEKDGYTSKIQLTIYTYGSK